MRIRCFCAQSAIAKKRLNQMPSGRFSRASLNRSTRQTRQRMPSFASIALPTATRLGASLAAGTTRMRWFAAACVACPAIRGTVFDSSVTRAEAAAQGAGVGLLPVAMFERELSFGRLVQPFDVEVSIGSYWLTVLKSKAETAAMRAFVCGSLRRLQIFRRELRARLS